MPERQQLFCEPGYDPLHPAIQFGRHGFCEWGNLGDTHGLSWSTRLAMVASARHSAACDKE
jgi:hypothetical protein